MLNPVENFPFLEDLEPTSGPLHGLYNTDKIRDDDAKRQTFHQFAGRNRIAYDSRRIYVAWAEALGAAEASLRLLSGLQAHAAVFMAATSPGDRVLLLPEIAGGHMATKAILERLSLEVVEMEFDAQQRCVDVEKTLRKIAEFPPDIVFIDRSEGLVYEDFTSLIEHIEAPTIFDCSQYLAQVITGDYLSPFDMGASMLISTVHKNFPGPQKALVASRNQDKLWTKVRSGLSTYVSNMHVTSTYASALTLSRKDWLIDYSSRMLENVMALDNALRRESLPIVTRSPNAPPTHHIWIGPLDRDVAFDWFKRLERSRINVNYRLLPYNIGYGLRLGLPALTRLGLKPDECGSIAEFIREAVDEASPSPKHKVRSFAEMLWSRSFS